MHPVHKLNSVLESTQLNGTTDKPVKQPKSSNKKRSAKSVAPVETAKSIDAVANGNSINGVQSPQLFTDEIGIADVTKSVTQSDEPSATYARYKSCVTDILKKSDKTDEPNISAETKVAVEPCTIDSSDVAVEQTTTVELNRKQGQNERPVAQPRVVYRQSEPPKQQNVVEAVAETVVGNGLDLFKVGPGYDPQEEAFAREMNRRKKKKKGIKF